MLQPFPRIVDSLEDALQVYRPFHRQQDAIDFAGECNAAVADANGSSVAHQADIVKVSVTDACRSSLLCQKGKYTELLSRLHVVDANNRDCIRIVLVPLCVIIIPNHAGLVRGTQRDSKRTDSLLQKLPRCIICLLLEILPATSSLCKALL